MNLSFSTSSRRVAFAAFVAVLVLVGLVGATTASASSAASTKAKGCGKQVVDDWYTHKTKIEGHYPLHCYQEALDSLGSDVGDYTNAKEVISAAAAAEALRCKTNCGPTDGNGPESSVLQPGEKPIARHNTYDFGGRPIVNNPPVTPPVNTSSPSSVPLPLIILAALAGILLLAGAGSYIARRLKANRPAPPATDTSS
jgi:hypothetical protein